MIGSKVKYLLWGLLLSELVILCVGAEYNKLAVFGDSISDNGNVFRLTNGTWPTSISYKGRFSNGKVWPEYLRARLAVPLLDYAYGSATTDFNAIPSGTGPNSTIPVPGVVQQIQTYLNNTKKRDIPKTIFVVFAGSNDYFFTNFLAAPKDVVQRLRAITLTLYKAGARKFILGNLPPFKRLPYLTLQNNQTLNAFVNSQGTLHNKLLENSVRRFAKTRAGTIQLLDVFSAVQNVITNKRKYKIKNTKDFCADPLAGTVCSKPSSYLWWDSFHFTTVVHEQIAKAAQKVVVSNKVFV